MVQPGCAKDQRMMDRHAVRHRFCHSQTRRRVIMKTGTGLAAIAAAVIACSVASTSASAQTPLYYRLGGYDAILAVVDDFIANVAADKRINGFFAHTDIPSFRRKLADFICVGTGGPCIYFGRDMVSAHAGMGIRNRHFTALVQDLGKSLKKFRVPPQEQTELAAILAPMKRDIVTR
jgi:hemoglobin